MTPVPCSDRLASRPRPSAATASALAALIGLLAAVLVVLTVPDGEAAPAAVHPAVVETRVIGRSVEGRPIRAYRLGEPSRGGVPRVVLIATMHGDEQAPRRILRTLLEGPEIIGVDLWLVPTYNPDGAAAGTRANARGVDPNRNYPYRWADLDGRYESGARPASEPETRAMMRFLSAVDPQYVLSFHQPLHGVDTDTKDPAFARRVAAALQLPRAAFTCGSTCHGTLTMWFNHRFDGTALTVEYGARPSLRTLTRQAPRALLRLFGAEEGGYAITSDPTPTSSPTPTPTPTPTPIPTPSETVPAGP